MANLTDPMPTSNHVRDFEAMKAANVALRKRIESLAAENARLRAEMAANAECHRGGTE